MSGRELKFRAWDNDRKQYFYSDAYGLEGFFARHADEPLEQYTGLRDKRGREIYEGDIIGLGSINGMRTKGDVVFHNSSYRIRIEQIGMQPLYLALMCDPIYSNAGEIIGNIRENADLLEAA